MQIIPSILVQNVADFQACFDGLENSAPHIQLDIADGEFVNNTTWADPKFFKDLKTNITIELHLMLAHPLVEISKWNEVANVTKILFHLESNDDIYEVISVIKTSGREVGIVLNPTTPIDKLATFVNELDTVMLMGVTPGKQGQTFIPETLNRLREVKTLYQNLFVELDGGVNESTLPEIIQTGVDAVCPGSAIFGNDRSPKENVERMKKDFS